MAKGRSGLPQGLALAISSQGGAGALLLQGEHITYPPDWASLVREKEQGGTEREKNGSGTRNQPVGEGWARASSPALATLDKKPDARGAVSTVEGAEPPALPRHLFSISVDREQPNPFHPQSSCCKTGKKGRGTWESPRNLFHVCKLASPLRQTHQRHLVAGAGHSGRQCSSSPPSGVIFQGQGVSTQRARGCESSSLSYGVYRAQRYRGPGLGADSHQR